MGMRLVASASVAALVIASARHVCADEGASSRTPVFVDSDDSQLTLLERTPQGDYLTICKPPCSLELRPGLFQGAVSRGDDKTRLDVGDVLIPRQPVRLQLHIDHGRGTRVGGWVMFGLGLGAGVSSFFGFFVSRLNSPTSSAGWLGAMFGSLGLSAFGLAIVLTSKDSASVVISPAVTASAGRIPSLGPALTFTF